MINLLEDNFTCRLDLGSLGHPFLLGQLVVETILLHPWARAVLLKLIIGHGRGSSVAMTELGDVVCRWRYLQRWLV